MIVKNNMNVFRKGTKEVNRSPTINCWNSSLSIGDRNTRDVFEARTRTNR